MVDLAVPRDIEPEVGELEDVFLYSVDDLSQVIDSNLKNRQAAAREAEVLIEQGVENYIRKERGLGIVSTLRNFREKAEQLRDTELDKALKALEKGASPQDVVKELARLLTNKLIHAPSVQMKKASARPLTSSSRWPKIVRAGRRTKKRQPARQMTAQTIMNPRSMPKPNPRETL